MGLQGDDGELLAGDPIPDPVTAGTTNTYEDTSHSAIVDGDEFLWNDYIFEQEVITIVEESEGQTGPTTELDNNVTEIDSEPINEAETTPVITEEPI